MNDMRATISQNIKEFRKAAGLTQWEMQIDVIALMCLPKAYKK